MELWVEIKLPSRKKESKELQQRKINEKQTKIAKISMFKLSSHKHLAWTLVFVMVPAHKGSKMIPTFHLAL